MALGYTRSYVSQVEAGMKTPGDRFLRDLSRLERGEGDSAISVSTLRLARERHGLSVAQAAKRLGIDIGVLQAIESGQGKASERLLDKICETWPEVEKADLMRGSDHVDRVMDETARYGATGQTPDIATPDGDRPRYVPLISWAQAGTMASFTDDAYQGDATIAFNVTDRRAIAVRIRGDSMSPRFQENDIAILYPSREPRAGNLVIARLRPECGDDVMFKLFQPTQSGRRVVLSSYNPAYPPIEHDRADFSWIYPVASVVQNFTL